MSNEIKEIIEKFISQVTDKLGKRIKKIILYGSYARGDYNKFSDIDIMILTDLSYDEIEKYRNDISDIAFDIELETGIIISPVIKNIDKYKKRINIIPFYNNVEKEGVVLVNG